MVATGTSGPSGRGFGRGGLGVEAEHADATFAQGCGVGPDLVFEAVGGDEDDVGGAEGFGAADAMAEAGAASEGVVDDAGDADADVIGVFQDPSGVVASAPEPDGVDAVVAEFAGDLAEAGEAAEIESAAFGSRAEPLLPEPSHQTEAGGAGLIEDRLDGVGAAGLAERLGDRVLKGGTGAFRERRPSRGQKEGLAGGLLGRGAPRVGSAEVVAIDGLGEGSDAGASADEAEPEFVVLRFGEARVVTTDGGEGGAPKHHGAVRQAIPQVQLPREAGRIGGGANGDAGSSIGFDDVPRAANGDPVRVAVEGIGLELEAVGRAGVVVVHAGEEFVPRLGSAEVEGVGEVGVGGFEEADAGVGLGEGEDSRTFRRRDAVEDQEDLEIAVRLGGDGGEGSGEAGTGAADGEEDSDGHG